MKGVTLSYVNGRRGWCIALAFAFLASIAALLLTMSTPERADAQNQTPLGFVVKCDFRTTAYKDFVTDNPTHNHAFFGGAGTEAGTPANVDGNWLRNYSGNEPRTTCNVAPDKAMYWVPTLKKDRLNSAGTAVASTDVLFPESVHAYYRAKGVTSAKPHPNNMEMLIGTPGSTTYQTGVVQWQCSGGNDNGEPAEVSDTPINCPLTGENQPSVRVFGPECYKDANGDGTPDTPTASDFKSHTEQNAPCEPGFVRGIAIDQVIRWAPGTNVEGRTYLSSDPSSVGGSLGSYGNAYKTMHADFMDGWNRTVLNELVAECVADGSGCNLAETEDIAEN